MCSYLHFRELEHVSVPACLSVRKIHFSHFCDCQTLDPWFPLKYAPVSTPSSFCIGCRVMKGTGASYWTKYTLCNVASRYVWTVLESFKICNFFVGGNIWGNEHARRDTSVDVWSILHCRLGHLPQDLVWWPLRLEVYISSFVEPPSLATFNKLVWFFWIFLQQFWFDPRTLIAKKPLPNVSVHGNKKLQVLGQHGNKKCRSLHMKLWRSDPGFFSRHSSPVLFLV